MTIDRNHPRWTAYVLGELEDRERVEFEKEMDSTPGTEAILAETRDAVSLLREGFAAKSPAYLSAEQKRELEAEAAPRVPWFRNRLHWAIGGAAAAVVLLGVVTLTVPTLLRSWRAADASLIASHVDTYPPLPPPPPSRTQGAPPPQWARSLSAPLVVSPGNSGVSGAGIHTYPGVAGGLPPDRSGHDVIDRNQFNTEEYDRILDNRFIAVREDPLATFSIDVDTAAYANVRRFLNQYTRPPRDAVRIEEMVNYFTYDYAGPTDEHPIRIHAEVAPAPWSPEHRLVRLGVQGRRVPLEKRPPSNLVFLIDVSGSMEDADKLPLLKDGRKLLVKLLDENDRVAIVVYAGASSMVLPSTPGARKQQLLQSLDRLAAGGSTNGGAGISLAYDTAAAHFIKGGTNRVILATDGDFNVGVTDEGALTRLIEEKAATGVFLSVLGFGTGNYNDAGLEALAHHGNGNYAYIDTIREARKVLVEQMRGTLITIAKDVKIQVEFNPAEVNAYRLIGYENRVLEHQDFNDDAKDAGEMGSGHTVTVLFEVVPAGVDMPLPGVDPLKYQTPNQIRDEATRGELLSVKVRYKEPDGEVSRRLEVAVPDRDVQMAEASTDYRFAAAVAGFGMILRDSPHRGQATLDSILRLAEASLGRDEGGYRAEFVELVRKASTILLQNEPTSPAGHPN